MCVFGTQECQLRHELYHVFILNDLSNGLYCTSLLLLGWFLQYVAISAKAMPTIDTCRNMFDQSYEAHIMLLVINNLEVDMHTHMHANFPDKI